MKHLRIEGVRQISRMVPRLHELGLLECRKCDDPANQRRNIDGVMICTTCEDTAAVFWRRNIDKLKEDEIDILEVRWETMEVYREIRAIAIKQAVRKATTTTTRTEHIPQVGENVAHDETITTERVEWIVDSALLRLAGDTQTKIARMAGIDVEEPEDGDKPGAGERGVVTIELPDGVDIADYLRPSN